MKRNITILLMFLAFGAKAQNLVQLEYFFDRDAGVGKNNVVDMNRVPDGAFPFTFSAAGLSQGMHQLYIRTKDSLNSWSQVTRRTIEIVATEKRPKILNGEYFLDNDPGYGSGTPVVASSLDSLITENLLASVINTQPGYHKLYQRWLDSSGRWSQTSRRNFEVVRSTDSLVIAGLEYAFGTDPGVGKAQFLPASGTNGLITFTIPRRDIPIGYWPLYLRAKDSIASNFSITLKRDSVANFIIVPLDIINFSAEDRRQYIHLKWNTENEVNTGHFDVERSTDGVTFRKIGRLNAKGNRSPANAYSYNDTIGEQSFQKYYYRLLEIDLDGSGVYSETKRVERNSQASGFSLLPNPATTYLKLLPPPELDLSNALILITDLSGRTLIKLKVSDRSNLTIPVSALTPGIYTVSLVTSTVVQTQKLIIK